MPTYPVIEQRALNRATLARQLLLGRSARPEVEVIEHLAGLQAQTPWGSRSPGSLAQAVRMWEPLAQVPPRGTWGRSGAIRHTSAEQWLGRPLADHARLDDLGLRYPAAFGPASVKDMQVWSGLTRLREVVERLRHRLVGFTAEDGRELLDVADTPRPGPDVGAPVRYMYDFDNLFLGYADWSRVITPAYRGLTIPKNIVPGVLLVDGFTEGTWRIVRRRDRAALVVKPLRPLTTAQIDEAADEGVRLLDFAEADASDRNVRFLPQEGPEDPWTASVECRKNDNGSNAQTDRVEASRRRFRVVVRILADLVNPSSS